MRNKTESESLNWPGARYESLVMHNAELPVRVELRRSNARSGGCELHWHEELEFYYVKKGGVSLICNGDRQWLHPGDIGFVNWCVLHRSLAFLDETEHYIIQIGTKLFADEQITEQTPGQAQRRKENLLLLCIAQQSRLPVFIHDNRALQTQMEIIVEETRLQEPGYELKIRAAVYNILIDLIRAAGVRPGEAAPADLPGAAHLRRILAYLSFHYTNPEEVTLPALSAAFGLSVPYLCRIFKRHTTLTITGYINELRCSRAAAFIQAGLPLDEVAGRTGFRDYNYFSRVFTKTVGLPPSEYRRKNSQTK